MKIEIPSDADLPAALAKLMVWKSIPRGTAWCWQLPSGSELLQYESFCARDSIDRRLFSPLTDRNHSRLAVEECFDRGLALEYAKNLEGEIKGRRQAPLIPILSGMKSNQTIYAETMVPINLIRAMTENEARAAYLTLAEYNQKKDKP